MNEMLFDFWEDFDGDADDATIEILDAIDTDDDGMPDLLVVDSDGDGIEDMFFSDDDGDGELDSVIADFNDDGEEEIMEFEEDSFASYDSDDFDDDDSEFEDDYYDLVPDESENNPDAVPADIYEDYGHIEPGETEGIVGDISDAYDSWHSQTGNTCAVCSQEFVLEDILGREFSEDELTEIAESNGWFDDGTPMDDIGNLLEYYGIQTERSEGNTIEDLRDSLEDGNKIIVALDADELWSGQNSEWFGPGMDANHAVQVVGIDERDPDDIRVIINDSGAANGNCVSVPADAFKDAWEDSNCLMVEALSSGFGDDDSNMIGTVQV